MPPHVRLSFALTSVSVVGATRRRTADSEVAACGTQSPRNSAGTWSSARAVVAQASIMAAGVTMDERGCDMEVRLADEGSNPRRPGWHASGTRSDGTL